MSNKTTGQSKHYKEKLTKCQQQNNKLKSEINELECILKECVDLIESLKSENKILLEENKILKNTNGLTPDNLKDIKKSSELFDLINVFSKNVY